MSNGLNLEQRFALQRARYEMGRMSRPALERTALRLLRSRMLQKNQIQEALLENGILFKVEEIQGDVPEIMSEETFGMLLKFSLEDDEELPSGLEDVGWEDEDLGDDGLMMFDD